MQAKAINTEKVFGKPAVSFIGLQVYYDCYKHQDDQFSRRIGSGFIPIRNNVSFVPQWVRSSTTPKRA